MEKFINLKRYRQPGYITWGSSFPCTFLSLWLSPSHSEFHFPDPPTDRLFHFLVSSPPRPPIHRPTDWPMVFFFFNFTFCQTQFSAFFFPLDLRLADRPTNRLDFSVGRSVWQKNKRLIAVCIFWLVGPSVGLSICQCGGCNNQNQSVTSQKYNWNLAWNTRKDAHMYPGWHSMERCEWMSERTSEWDDTLIAILGCTEP